MSSLSIHLDEAKIMDRNSDISFNSANSKIQNLFFSSESDWNNHANSNIQFKFKEKVKENEKNLVKSNEVVYESWVKIIVIKGKSKNPVKFNINDKFIEQSNDESVNVHEKDEKGYLNIPSKEYFYGTLTKDNLVIYTARKGQLKNIKISIDIEDIVRQKGNTFKGGIEDLGNFKEGHCFIVKYISMSNKGILEMCTENLIQKNEWMKKLVKLVKKDEKSSSSTNKNSNNEDEQGTEKIVDEIRSQTIIQSPIIPTVVNPIHQVNAVSHPAIVPQVQIPHPLMVENHIAPAGAIITNNLVAGTNNVVALKRSGFVPVGEWTPCTKPCGIGLQSRILQCIRPPDCEGNNFEERQCNIQACKSDLDAHLNNLKKVAEGKWEFLGSWSICSAPCGIGYQTINRKCIAPPCTGPLVVKQTCNLRPCNGSLAKATKVFDYSNYPECQPTEMFLKIKDMTGLFYEAKIILSIEHIQILKTHESLPYITLPLNHILSFHRDPIQPNCVDVTKDTREDIVFCPNSDPDNFINIIANYKNNCSSKVLDSVQADLNKQIVDLSNPANSALKMASLSDEILAEEKSKQKMNEAILDTKLEEFRKQAKEVLQKEENYEHMLVSQQQDMLSLEEKRSRQNQLGEIAAANKLISDIQAIAENDSNVKLKRALALKEMQQTMSDVQNQIAERRRKLLDRMKNMKVLHEIKQRNDAKKLLDEKRAIGKKLSNLTKLGNPIQCFNKSDLGFITAYCRANILDLEIQNECMKPKQFCYICCDNEIGSINKEHKDCCYNKCDKIPQSTCSSFIDSYNLRSLDGVAAPMITPNPLIPANPLNPLNLPPPTPLGAVPIPASPVFPNAAVINPLSSTVAIPQEY